MKDTTLSSNGQTLTGDQQIASTQMGVELSPECAIYNAERRRECCLAALNLEVEVKTLERAIKQVELETTARISSATDDLGKPLYGNADRRAAAVAAALDETSSVLEWRSRIDDAKQEALQLRAHERFHGDVKEIICSFAGGGK